MFCPTWGHCELCKTTKAWWGWGLQGKTGNSAQHQFSCVAIKVAADILLIVTHWAFKEWEAFQHGGKPETVTGGEAWHQQARGHRWLSLWACLQLWLSGDRWIPGRVQALQRDPATKLQRAAAHDSGRQWQIPPGCGGICKRRMLACDVLDVNRLFKTREAFFHEAQMLFPRMKFSSLANFSDC